MGKMLDTTEAGDHIGVPGKTLANWRSLRKGPPFVKLAGRTIRYREEDLDAYIAENRCSPEEIVVAKAS
jgi:hypothetical protein